ncbi:ADP compounds hydrolase NudE [Alishewanella tabrizica]|uniref:ADP compounds hydrolase NudE n=1 Tax=Alishewanella tabrizica TaxID=671278 RepID=A0ABQ2WUA3_9ALTE|nr:ADP compounds hydrolase NudE [Alishewanella tabrizica]GGW68601.1 ADP compounds hydrolase NudE [Alishewanella tabrizica]
MTQRHNDKQKPDILAAEIVAKSRLFKVEQLQLRFSNGEERTYERMVGTNRGAVMIVACPDPDTLYLVREYCAGTHDYQLGFPKGLIDPGEDILTAANRELKEEIGFGAARFIQLKSLALAPGYFNATMHVVLAFDLYAEHQTGDEPEPLELVSWSRQDTTTLLQQADFTEARSVAALLLAQQYLEANPDVFKQSAGTCQNDRA